MRRIATPTAPMSPEQAREERHHALLGVARTETEIGRMAADLRTDVVAELVADQDLAVALRAQAWLREDPELTIARDLSNVPDGWPPNVDDPRAYVLGQIRERVEPALEASFGARSTGRDADDVVSPSVAALRKRLDE